MRQQIQIIYILLNTQAMKYVSGNDGLLNFSSD